MTKTDLVNRALGVLGHDRTITDYDGMTGSAYNDTSTEAVRARLFLPVALADALASYNWDFAAVERTYRLSWTNGQGYAIINRPSDCARLVEVMDDEERPVKVKQANGKLYIKNDDAGDKVTVRWISSDASLDDFPPKFTDAVVHQLAALLSGPMLGDAQKTNGYLQLAKQKISDAITAEADETAFRGETRNPFVTARG